ncbi:hypothetical protein ON021_00675, partial [Microcoleus sp. HI-ES]|nr:hypothetical protein [Microcoleus sp. HI-ES]
MKVKRQNPDFFYFYFLLKQLPLADRLSPITNSHRTKLWQNKKNSATRKKAAATTKGAKKNPNDKNGLFRFG